MQLRSAESRKFSSDGGEVIQAGAGQLDSTSEKKKERVEMTIGKKSRLIGLPRSSARSRQPPRTMSDNSPLSVLDKAAHHREEGRVSFDPAPNAMQHASLGSTPQTYVMLHESTQLATNSVLAPRVHV